MVDFTQREIWAALQILPYQVGTPVKEQTRRTAFRVGRYDFVGKPVARRVGRLPSLLHLPSFLEHCL